MSEPGSSQEAPLPDAAAVRRLLDALPEAVLFERRGRVVAANAAAVALAGATSARALVGRSVESILARSGESDREVERLEGGPDGDVVWRVRPAGGDPELARARCRVEQLDRELTREAERRQELLEVLGHELRTPVTVIAGFHRLVLSEEAGDLSAEQRRFLTESERSCRRLAEFVEQLLAGARKGGWEDGVEPRDLSMDPLVEELAASLEPLLEGRGLGLRLHLDRKAARARFDPIAVRRVLTNLVSNAVEHAPAGSTVEVATRRCGRGTEAVVEVSVSDEGAGLAPEDRERVFEPYVQAGDGRPRGLGLGLAIARRLVEAQGGRIGVEAAAAGGCRFWFTLPAADGGEEPGR